MEFLNVGDELRGEGMKSRVVSEQMNQASVINDLDVYKTTFCWWIGCQGDAIGETEEFDVPYTEDWNCFLELKGSKSSGIRAHVKNNCESIKAYGHENIKTNANALKTPYMLRKDAIALQTGDCVYYTSATNFYVNSDDSDSEDSDSLCFSHHAHHCQ
ncbi:hypothetical protein HK407_04g07520 [Ordospora pajunii]|uniref:uncharacterized protein n=1 Tax=Ordospora pajunii TaxID=3039483 RepID=UPI0029528E85|nr:uncharacterized protein HK407_04g07520 [Ordospora pajunii]KAH9411645.1 hypothetical protein HK407_04g07520 [Ordospora pajunii]